mgnify:CR=1 FL=1
MKRYFVIFMALASMAQGKTPNIIDGQNISCSLRTSLEINHSPRLANADEYLVMMYMGHSMKTKAEILSWADTYCDHNPMDNMISVAVYMNKEGK